MAQQDPSTLDAWIERIRDQEMPIFGTTAREITALAEDDHSSVSTLTQAVLQDAAMTAKLLRLANSAYFNPARSSISTVSRAVVVLGLDLVRGMVVSIRLIDSLLVGGSRRRVVQHMARALHAGVQARSAALARHDTSPEEVFIAAMLMSLGELAFWCFAGESADRLDALLVQPGVKEEEAETVVLGFRIKQLTAGLAKEWNLTPLLQSAAQGKGSGKREQGVILSHRLATALEGGWDTVQARRVLEEYARFLGAPVSEVLERVKENAREAARVAAFYGATAAARLIPVPDNTAVVLEAAEEIEHPEYPEPDPMLQLKILRELSGLLAAKPDINSLLQMVLEGIFRGVGMDRTLFALLSPDRTMLRTKYVLGAGRGELAEVFQFSVGKGSTGMIAEVIEKRRSYWVKGPHDREAAPFVTAEIRAVVGETGFFITPIIVHDRAIGVFYADRGVSGRVLDADAYESFLHFAQQANLGLEHLTRQPS
jgi:HD-like signal output (HDOD) protein